MIYAQYLKFIETFLYIFISDCVDIVKAGHKSAGVYRIQPSTSATSFDVFCSPPPKPEWIVIQHRYDGSENFTRPWEHYKQGFGSFNGEFWLGNEKIYLLTNQKPYTLRVELQLWDGSEFWAEYGSFRLEPEDQNYRLRIGNYSGNAGDSMRDHNGKAFTTMDSDNDDFDFGNCAQMNKGAWWYNECQDSNLNGRYKVNCSLPNCNRWFKDLGQKGMKVTTMKIKPNLN